MLNVLSKNSTYLKILNTQSRSIDVQGNQLAEVHQNIGKVLGQAFLDTLPLRDVEVTNPQGKIDVDKKLDGSNITIICLMRAGLYLAQGVRELLGDNQHVYLLSNSPDDVAAEYMTGRDVVIVDSVINSGKTLINYLSVVKGMNSVTVICLVMQEKFKPVIQTDYPNVNFIVSRVSQNSYVGAGKTDTGNRLFGTF